MSHFSRQTEGTRSRLKAHVARVDIVLQVAIASDQVKEGAAVSHIRCVCSQTVGVTRCCTLGEIRIRIGIGEGSTDNPVIVDAIVATDLDGGVIHFNFIAAAPLRFAAVDASPCTDGAFSSTDVSQTLREMVDFVSPLHEAHGVQGAVVSELHIGRSRGAGYLAVFINCLSNRTADVAFFNRANLSNMFTFCKLYALLTQSLHISFRICQIISVDTRVFHSKRR